jgi:hypothetical protein
MAHLQPVQLTFPLADILLGVIEGSWVPTGAPTDQVVDSELPEDSSDEEVLGVIVDSVEGISHFDLLAWLYSL